MMMMDGGRWESLGLPLPTRPDRLSTRPVVYGVKNKKKRPVALGFIFIKRDPLVWLSWCVSFCFAHRTFCAVQRGVGGGGRDTTVKIGRVVGNRYRNTGAEPDRHRYECVRYWCHRMPPLTSRGGND